MIELEKHIEILLLDNDCVIVPGFGGFVAHYVDARFDKDSNVFLPPFRMLGFNPKLDMNDSLLVQSYVEAYDISYPEAQRRIDSEVIELKRSLEIEGYYELDNIGTILVNDEGKYEFEPCEAGVLTPGLYGLVGTELQTLDAEDVKTAVSLAVPCVWGAAGPLSSSSDTERFSGGVDVETLSAGGVVKKNEPSENGERVISVRVSVLRNIVAVACAIIAFFMLATPISNGSYEDDKQMGGIGNGLLYNLIPKDGGMQSVQLLCAGSVNLKNDRPNKKVDNANPSENNNGANSVSGSVVRKASGKSVVVSKTNCNNQKGETEIQTENGYCIVLACRITKSNAEEYVGRLRSEGYSNVRLDGNRSSLKVVYGSYSSEEEALSELKAFRNKDAFKDAWIFHVK